MDVDCTMQSVLSLNPMGLEEGMDDELESCRFCSR